MLAQQPSLRDCAAAMLGTQTSALVFAFIVDKERNLILNVRQEASPPPLSDYMSCSCVQV